MARNSMMALMMAVMLMVGCGGNPSLDYDDQNNNDAAVNNNDAGSNTNNQTTPDGRVEVTVFSTSRIAVWAQDKRGNDFFGPALTEDCLYTLTLSRPSVFLVSAEDTMRLEATAPVELYLINQDPESDWSFWQYEFMLKNLYMLPGYWYVKRFPTSWTEAEGFLYSMSGFVCGKHLDMINQGCSSEIPGEFFDAQGSTRSANFTQDSFGEIFVFGVLR